MRLEYFQMIDKVTQLRAAEAEIVVAATIPMESPIFEGHFPGHPIMPGVLLIEAMAQASGYLLLGLNGFSKMPFLASVKEAKLRSFVLPGAELTIDATRIHAGSGYAVTKTTVRSQGKRVCNAELSFRIVPFPDASVEAHVRERGLATGLLGADGLIATR